MKILVTGAGGFIGKNFLSHAAERQEFEILTLLNGQSQASLADKVAQADFIVHLAGINRPKIESEFIVGNVDLTRNLCEAIKSTGRHIPVIFSSSTQSELNNSYGASKNQAEQLLNQLTRDTGNPVTVYRLTNVFGKWCRPNYNSVVATFCHNVANDLEIHIVDPEVKLNLVYVDDVVDDFFNVIQTRPASGYRAIDTVYQLTLGELARYLNLFKSSRSTLLTEQVGTGLLRALYATYISYLTPANFSYPLVKHEDPRGVFSEVLKTRNSGQFSFFTAHPGVTRGGHYHHTKSEKFVVLKGTARFGFRHIVTGEVAEIFTDGQNPQVVETVPGWSHDITNTGSEEMIVMLWANEIFDLDRPDTFRHKV